MSSQTLVIMAFNQALPSALMGIADMFALANLSQQHSISNKTAGNKIGAAEIWRPKVLIACPDG
jgi:hypothetical protein